MSTNIEDFSGDEIEPTSLARRRELPDMLRDFAQVHAVVVLTLDAETALRLADDLEFAVKYRGIENGN